VHERSSRVTPADLLEKARLQPSANRPFSRSTYEGCIYRYTS
jgi:hypothetical protein